MQYIIPYLFFCGASDPKVKKSSNGETATNKPRNTLVPHATKQQATKNKKKQKKGTEKTTSGLQKTTRKPLWVTKRHA